MMIVRKIKQSDTTIWSVLRTNLWPDTSDQHLQEISEFFDQESIDIEEVFVVENHLQEVVGFIELNIREFAEGSRHSRVPYVEAWYVDTAARSQGYGKLLMETAEWWAKEMGFEELASDTEVDNDQSIAAHKKLGFEEVERIVCFLKKI